MNRAYKMAEEIGQRMVTSGISRISEQDLTDMTYHILIDDGYPRIASFYQMWHSLRKKKQSLVVLLGGATGIGKSTVAFEISYRLGIHSIIGTDVVREVMRKMVSRDLLPTLHTSSFSAWKEIQAPSSFLSAVIYAFELQVSHVAVGINAIINRALTEGFSLVMEGIHLVPGYVERQDRTIFHFVLTLSDREEHVNRFYARAKDSRRPPEHYLENIDKIRQIQDHIVGRANRERVPVLENIALEETVTQILNRMYDQLQKEAATDE